MTFAYAKPATLPEALALASANPAGLPILAGGTDLLVKWRSGAIRPAGFIDISGIEGLRTISESDGALEIGALATHAAIATNPPILSHCPALAAASLSIGSAEIRNRGTIGGNIMNASPAGDLLPVLVAFDAEFLAQDLRGERWIRAGDFFTGYRRTALAAGEILTRVRTPKSRAGEVARFYKVGARRAQSVSKVAMCARAEVDHGGIKRIAIAVGGAAPTVMRLSGTESLLRGRAATASLIERARLSAEDEVRPIDDLRSTAAYRRFACGGLLVRFLRECVSQAEARDKFANG